MPTKEEALTAIREAFAGVGRPANHEFLHLESYDDMDLVDLYEVDLWVDMTDEQVINSYAAPNFLSAAGFRYFLPAYMHFSLNNPDSAEAVVSATIWALDPSLYSDEIAAYARSKYEFLDEPRSNDGIELRRGCRPSPPGVGLA